MEDKFNNEFEVFNDLGEKITCNALFTFESDETGKNYIVYTDNTKDHEGNIRVYASIYKTNGDKTELEAIESEREWKIVETILNSIQEESRKEENN